MQRRSLVFCAMILALTAVAAWAVDISGTWTGNVSGPNGDFSLTYTLKQNGDKLTGSVTGPTDPIEIQEGKVDGDKISFALNVDMAGNNVKFVSKGTIKGDEIKLTSTNDAGMDMGGEMTLKKQK